MRPVVDRLEEDYGDQMKFVRLDADHEGEAAFKAGRFPGHPSFVIVQPDGQEAWRKAGLVPEDEMETAILEALAGEG